ncbi:DNA-protecting protein DprA [Candidatus Collierbacteria bacterium]|nr:DNA-protecting protein DprA [Candidatus Collierbacteria bacterium]
MTIEDLKKKIKKLGLTIDGENGRVLVEWKKVPFAETDRPYWAGLSSIDGVGPNALPLLVSCFGSAKNVLFADKELLTQAGIPVNVAARIIGFSGKNDINKWFDKALNPEPNINLSFLTPKDKDFPERLLSMSGAPSHLWVWGDKTILNQKRIVAIVGTRKITPYGRSVTEILAEGLAIRGLIVISGLMYGVDEVAQRAALKNKGIVIGVWAGGITRKSFGSRARLAYEIVSNNGAVVSEFSFEKFPFKGTFPARNRIVSGLSAGVVITEAAAKSGSLITADCALDQGKPVGAVPGPITSPLSEGPNELLKNGATPTTNVMDILNMCGLTGKNLDKTFQYIPKNDNEKLILKLLADQNLTVDDLVRVSSFPISEISETLTSLELSGVVEQVGEEWRKLAN